MNILSICHHHIQCHVVLGIPNCIIFDNCVRAILLINKLSRKIWTVHLIWLDLLCATQNNLIKPYMEYWITVLYFYFEIGFLDKHQVLKFVFNFSIAVEHNTFNTYIQIILSRKCARRGLFLSRLSTCTAPCLQSW